MCKQEVLNTLEASFKRQLELAAELRKKNPNLGITALVIAGDMLTAENCTNQVKLGANPLDLLWRVGSYARFDWAYKHLDKADLLRLLAELWVSSDPNDTNLEYLNLWEEKRRMSGKIILDDKELPAQKVFLIYRGQARGSELGISWTLDKNIASKFSNSGGLRERISGGIQYKARIRREHILAYLTSRNEAEVIINPENLI